MLQGASTSAKTNFKSLQQTALVIAVLQSVLVVPAFVVAVYFNLMPLLNQRRLLFTVFLAIPRHLVVRLSATREDLAADDDARRAAEADEAAFQSKKPSSLLAWTRPERSIEIDRATQRRVSRQPSPPAPVRHHPALSAISYPTVLAPCHHFALSVTSEPPLPPLTSLFHRPVTTSPSLATLNSLCHVLSYTITTTPRPAPSSPS